MKNSILSIFLLLIIVSFSNCSKEKYKQKEYTDSNGYSYKMVTNDPMGVRIYTLKNGLTVFFSVTKDAPRVQTLISVKAGSIHDPVETTGLAHYFEHMMFKGSSKLGTTNWEKENMLLTQITDLFEKRRLTSDSIEKIKIFASIDSLSILASKYAIPNEYDKIMQLIGGQGSNAFTSFQGTSYIEDIPSNEIERWLDIQYDRFSDISLRLFHTELETVYEEFNMSQDRDSRKFYFAKMKGLFPGHPLSREVLGYGKDLKNPSIVNIRNFFNKYYVPNNMAIIMSGDFDMDKTIKMIDNTFGKLKEKPVVKPTFPELEPITKPIVKEVVGPDAENVAFAYRFRGDSTEDKKYVTLIDMILNNSVAGLIDLDLVQQQKVLRGGSNPEFFIDYGIHTLWGYPREGQTLDDVKDLLMGELNKVKKGEFDDWLISAVINDLRLQSMQNQEYYQNRAYIINDMFQNNGHLINETKFYDDLEKITKEQLVKFANENYKDNYVLVYKRKGTDSTTIKMPKPKITAVDINRNAQSAFYSKIASIKTQPIQPVYVDFEKDLQKKEIKPGVEFFYIPNITNELFDLQYIVDMGKSNNKKLELALKYLPYIGTDKYTPAQVKQEFYKLGVRFSARTNDERSYVSISGLDKSLEPAISLFEDVLNHAKSDTSTYHKFVDGVLKTRSDNKTNKDYILQNAMVNYGKYNKYSPFTDIISEEEMHTINPEELTKLVHELGSYKQRILFYGKPEMQKALDEITKKHQLPDVVKEITKPTSYTEDNFSTNKVYFVNFDMVQANFMLLDKLEPFKPEILPYTALYNDYYYSIIFQEIREARGLAYSAGSWAAVPDKMNKSVFLTSYVATQADKLKEASSTLMALLKNMKEDQQKFDLSKDNILRSIETERIIKTDIFWTYLRNLDRGITTDYRKNIYDKVKTMSMAELKEFMEKQKPRNYTLLVIGKKGSVDENVLKKLGDYKELTLEEVFNY